MITFLTPLFLVGLLSAAIPLLIHLSRSRRTKTLRFSTTRFFTDQFLRSYRMSRLKELLLLACRMALCALLATALARPLFLPKGQSFLTSGPRSVVLVIDNSASMAYVENGVTLLDRAKAAARELLEGLRPGDTASVVLAGRRAAGPDVLFPEPTPELGDVLQAVTTLQPAALGTDLAGAVAAAEKLRFPEAAQSKEIYVLSDLQDAGLEDEADRPADGGASDLLYFFVRVRPRAVANVAVTAVQYGASRPMVGVPFAIRPHVAVQGGPARDGEARLYIDGKKVAERKLEKLADGRWAAPRFHHTFTTGGWHSGYLEIPDDALALDNRRYFAFEVLESIKLLAVNGAPSQVERLDELFFLKKALDPEGKGPIQVEARVPAELGSVDLAGYPLVILANVESLTDAAVQKLEQFVDRGGSLLVFLGDKVNPTFYNDNLAAATRLHGGLLPGRLRAVEKGEKGEEIARVGEVDHEHVVLSAFQDPRFGDLSGVTFQALWGVEPAASAEVMMRASTGSPLLCEKAFGKGRVVLFASSCDRDWTNFPARVTFLPWTHRLIGYLAQEPLGRQAFFATGDQVPVPPLEGDAPVLVKKPDEKVGYAVALNPSPQPLAFRDTIKPGIYTLYPDRQGRSQLFAVNLESYESKLTYLDDGLTDDAKRTAHLETILKEKLPGRPLLAYVDDAGQLGDVALSARRGIKLWDVALFIVLVLALFEPWLANRISARHYARPREVVDITASRGGRAREAAPEVQEARP